MHEVLLGASLLKTRRKHLFPFHTSLNAQTLLVALRVANVAQIQIEHTFETSTPSICPSKLSLKRWKEWHILLQNVVYNMKKYKMAYVCVGYV